MIKIEQVSKLFRDKVTLNNISFNIEKGTVFGILGSNGSGKSTLLRLIAGIYKAETGKITIDEEDVYENIEFKNNLFLVSDEPYFFSQYSIKEMADYYKQFYTNWNQDTYKKLCEIFTLDTNLKISNFSKGMKRQALIILGLSTTPKYLLLDEAFDGLDTIMRMVLKKIIAEKMSDNGMTTIITSHNLPEFESICDNVAMLHKGNLLINKSLDQLTSDLTKVQAVLPIDPEIDMFKELNVLKYYIKGKLITLVVRDTASKVETVVNKLNPIFYEKLESSLEEAFLIEMEAVGYDANKVI